MTTIPLSKIKPNPHRDFHLFPYEDDTISALRHSMKQHGFFGGCKMRPKPAANGDDWDGTYEIGCGHHRMEAARREGLKEVENIFVAEMTDDEMIQLMSDENAVHAGRSTAAVLNDVSAATARIAYEMLACNGNLGEISPRLPKGLFPSKKSLDVALGTLKNGEGLGHNIIRRYLGNGDESRCPRKEQQVRDAVKTLKQSGCYNAIIDGIEERLKAEGKPTDGLDASRAKRRKRGKRILDERCASLFPHPAWFEAFKSAVLTRAGQRFIPVDKQYKLAKAIMAKVRQRQDNPKMGEGHYGGSFIAGEVSVVIDEAMRSQHVVDQEELEREQAELTLQKRMTTMLASIRSATSMGGQIVTMLRKNPNLRVSTDILTFRVKIDDLVKLLQEIKRQIGAKS